MNFKKIIQPVIFAFIGGLIALVGYSILSEKDDFSDNFRANELQSHFVNHVPEVLDLTFAANKSVNSVVHIMTQSMQNRNSFFYGQGSYPVVGSGSGVIISSDGYIVTNNHVVNGSENIEIILNDKRSFKATLIGNDPATDLALLKIEVEGLSVIELGNSDELQVGEWVLAVGNPFNLTSTVTAGIVSAKGRNINLLNKSYAIESFIQTDAAVNPGNSGGALVNVAGELVGINTAIASKTGSYSGYSFAVPVGIVAKVVADLKEFGVVQRALLGVSINDIDADFAEKKGLNKIEGVYIAEVFKGGAAANASMKKGDIILKIGDIIINKVSEYQEQINNYRPGDKINVTIKRDGKVKIVDLIFKNKLGNTNLMTTEVSSVLGAEFGVLNDTEKKALGITHGIEVLDLQAGKLLKAGVRKGFIIMNVNRMDINSLEDLKTAMNTNRGGVFVGGIYPDGETAYYAFGIN